MALVNVYIFITSQAHLRDQHVAAAAHRSVIRTCFLKTPLITSGRILAAQRSKSCASQNSPPSGQDKHSSSDHPRGPPSSLAAPPEGPKHFSSLNTDEGPKSCAQGSIGMRTSMVTSREDGSHIGDYIAKMALGIFDRARPLTLRGSTLGTRPLSRR